MLMNSKKEYFRMINKDRAHRLYTEIYMKCIYWIEQFLTMGPKKVIWKLVATKNRHVST